MSGAFYLYAGVITLAMPIVYVVLPETKNVSLELIPKYFEPKKTVFYVDLENQEDLSWVMILNALFLYISILSTYRTNIIKYLGLVEIYNFSKYLFVICQNVRIFLSLKGD